jgi:hypothetical protein
MFKKVFLKIVLLRDGVEKCGRARQATDDNVIISYAIARHSYVVHILPSLLGNFFQSPSICSCHTGIRLHLVEYFFLREYMFLDEHT